ncbi:hypothetical protein BJF79_05730 [Actinomadura sp. CNU-125]|nr:hypothetical protein BJF79_05730 [Actinomadura sp. CNU-125]
MTQAKEELYLRRVFNDDVPVFVDVTRYARRELPYPLSAKKALKATCGVRTDNEIVAFSLRHYTVRQAEREVEHVEDEGQNLLRPRMPRKTLHDLIETARALSSVLGDELIAELDGRLYVLRLTRAADGSTLELVGALTEGEDGYVRSEITGDRFELPVSGVRLRMFLRSPVRDRVLAYAFGGYLARRPGETETVGRAVASALNSLLGLATFRMLSGMNRVETADRSHEPVAFAVPVLLFTADGTPAARGDVAGRSISTTSTR